MIKKVSIIMVCHNQLQHTKRFINSLRRYTPQEPIQWELIVVDSGCTDGTSEWFNSEKTHSLAGPFKIYGFEENIGWIKGINFGLKQIKNADVVIFANNDVVLDKAGWLERLCAHFTETVGAVGPISNYVMGRQKAEFAVPHMKSEETNLLVGFFMAVKKEVIDQIGPLEENLHEYLPQEVPDDAREKLKLGGADDLDYSIRIRKAGYELKIAKDVFVWHSGSKTFFDVVGKEGYNQQWQTADLALVGKWGIEEFQALHQAKLKIAFGIPLRGYHPHWKFSSSLFRMQRPLDNWVVIDAPRSVVDQARNAIVEEAIKLEAHYILFLDDDHIIPQDLFYKLLSHQKDVVGALAFRRLPPYSPCVYDWETSTKDGNLMVRDRPDLIRKGLQKVDAIGFGAVLVRTEVFKKIGGPRWFRFDEVGEELTFCDLCAQKGISVYCDTDLILPHITDEGIEVTDETFFKYHQFQQGKAIA